jgi:SAM-dependent methyltransferase
MRPVSRPPRIGGLLMTPFVTASAIHCVGLALVAEIVGGINEERRERQEFVTTEDRLAPHHPGRCSRGTQRLGHLAGPWTDRPLIVGYEGSIAELYDYVGPYRTRPDIAFIVEAAATAGGPVLEIGCGTGRVLIPTARAGVEIVGLDLSPDMLTVCRTRLLDEPESVQSRVTLVQADMRGFALGRTFALVTIPFRPFQHLLTVEDQLSCLQSIHQHLENEGLLILDIFNPSLEALVNRPVGEELDEEPEFTMPDGRRVIRRHRTVSRDRFNQIDDHELIYYVTHPDGREERLVHSFQLRYLFRFEAEHLLARAGFAVEHLYAGYDKSEYGSRYPGELLFLARKISS